MFNIIRKCARGCRRFRRRRISLCSDRFVFLFLYRYRYRPTQKDVRCSARWTSKFLSTNVASFARWFFINSQYDSLLHNACTKWRFISVSFYTHCHAWCPTRDSGSIFIVVPCRSHSLDFAIEHWNFFGQYLVILRHFGNRKPRVNEPRVDDRAKSLTATREKKWTVSRTIVMSRGPSFLLSEESIC